MDRDDKIRRGEDAKRLLQDPLLIEAFDSLDAGYVDRWRAATDEKTKAACHFGVKTVAAVKRHLELAVQTGKIASDQILFEEEQKKRGVTSLFRRAQ